jgi:hypothetical protein
MDQAANDFLMSGGAPVAKFENVGDTWSGRIVKVDPPTQQTDLKGEPKFYNDGKPMMQVVITLQTDRNDPEIADDDGQRRLYVKGWMQTAIREAVKKAGCSSVEEGATLAVQYTGDGKSQGAGYNPPKLYRAQYKPPAVGVDDLLGAPVEHEDGGNGSAPPAASQLAADDLLPG